MRSVKVLALGALLGGALCGSANAAVFDITFTETSYPNNSVAGGPFTINAVVEGSLTDPNDYLITKIDSGSITIGTGASAITYNDIGLLPATSSPTELYGFDDVITSVGGLGPYSLTSGGLLFTSSSAPINGTPPASPTEFNLFVDGGGATVASDNSNNVNAEFRGDLTIDQVVGVSSTPLPSTWTMMIAGLIALAFLPYRRRRNRSSALAA
jgi:hypothetical protein